MDAVLEHDFSASERRTNLKWNMTRMRLLERDGDGRGIYESRKEGVKVTWREKDASDPKPSGGAPPPTTLPGTGFREAAEAVGKDLREKMRADMEPIIRDAVTKATLDAIDERFKDLPDSVKLTIAEHVKSAIEKLPHGPSTVRTPQWTGRKADDPNPGGASCMMPLPRKRLYWGERSIGQQTAVPGAAEGQITPWSALVEMDPFMQYAYQRQVNTGTDKVPMIAGIPFSTEATHPGNTARASSGGAISSSDVVLDLANSEMWATNAALNDVMDLRETIQYETYQQWGFYTGAACITTMKTHITAGNNEIKTGVAANLPTVANVYGKIVDVFSELTTRYRMMARWYLSRALEGRLLQSTTGTGGEYTFDPVLGVRTIEGYPTTVTDHLEDGTTADDLSCLFGNLRYALIHASGNTLLIGEEYRQTRPGAITFYSEGRFKAAIYHTDAIAGMTTGA